MRSPSKQDPADGQRRVRTNIESRGLATSSNDLGAQDSDHGAIVGAELGLRCTQGDATFG
jgi:hypothetical protein